MRLVKKFSVALFLIAALSSASVLAANNVAEIDIDVTVRDDGSAVIVQKWHGEFYEGTENYIPIATSDISVSELSVSDEYGEYGFSEAWDINAGFDEKARKCGINETADGVELCFGISEYGENRYTIKYTVWDFIKSYTDYDGTSFMFINPDMSTFPTDGRISIALENGTYLNEDNSAIWAFGYDGSVEFHDGTVAARTWTALDGDNSMIVMLRLSKGLVFPRTETGVDFDTLKDKAFEGSDYGDDTTLLETVIGFIVLFGGLLLLIFAAVFFLKRKKEIKRFYAEAGYFRDVPNKGKINVSHYLAQNFDVAGEDSLIIGALILSMINKGSIKPELENSVGFFGKEKQQVNLRLIKAPDEATEKSLYALLSVSAGDDGILQEKELEKYAYKNPEKINGFIDSVRESGESELALTGGFADGAGNRIKDLSDTGKAELAEVMGLKKYLEDFTLIAEREITETVIWKDYMVYATLFGISERGLKQLKAVYPEKVPELESYNRNVVIASSYYRSMYRSSQRALQAKRTSGGGGRASFGGGGGFSGGGSGGGSR